jgi:hypothetical protein
MKNALIQPGDVMKAMTIRRLIKMFDQTVFVKVNYYTEKLGFIGWDSFVLSGINYLSVYDESRRDIRITFTSLINSIIRDLEHKTGEKVTVKAVY